MNGPAPKVSVVIPCYNLGAYLDQAVKSVLDQTYKDFEIIIIDDGSTDPITRNLFTSYQRPYTRIFRTKNQGVMETRNLGIKEAKGKYLSFLDADDIFESNFLENTVPVLESDQGIAFASCWLKAFGAADFLWNPTSCDFPQLLAEDTVCTAALTRKEAIVAVGGFDKDMPLPGYEDWEIAINLVKHGFEGKIIPEYLFRYRIKDESLSRKATEPENHLLLMRYMVEKHAESYKNHLTGVINAIEKRTIELERSAGPPQNRENTYLFQENTFLKNTINAVLKSRSWRITTPLRHGYRLAKLTHEKIINRKVSVPRLSVIINCFNHQIELRSVIDSIRNQLRPEDEIIVVDDGSTNPITLQILDWYREDSIDIVNTHKIGWARAREIGLRKARGQMVFALNADQTIEPTLFEKVFELFDKERDTCFVLCGFHDDKTEYDWIPESLALPDILGCQRVSFPVITRESYLEVGGYDPNFDNTLQADLDFVIRLIDDGYRGALIPEPLIKGSRILGIDRIDNGALNEDKPLFKTLISRHRRIFDSFWKEAILGRDFQRQCLQFHLAARSSNRQNSYQPSTISWGGLRRTDPISPTWGVERGQPIDRYYMDLFLRKRSPDIHGRVLEVKDSCYTETYGQGLEKIDIIDIAKDNPSATIKCDLTAGEELPENSYDCFIITQTIHFIYDFQQVIKNVERVLHPGGVVLATLPCVSRIDYESGIDGDFWRFTTASARKLFEDVFGAGNVEIQAFGNVLACCAFLMGLSAGELTPDELNYHDPYFPLLICVRAVKPKKNALTTKPVKTSENQKAIILLYHRIENATRDRWNLCVTPQNFHEHLHFLKKHFIPVSLSELSLQIQRGNIKNKSIAVTFDDGYLDNLTNALPILNDFDFPATFFICGDGAVFGKTFWWESLDASAQLMNLDEKTIRDLHNRLMSSDIDERERILGGLDPPKNNLPLKMTTTDLKKLSQDKLAEVAAHGWSHRALSALSIEEQRIEVIDNIKTIRNAINHNVHSFSYPFGGFFTDDTKNLLREVGISVACTVDNETVTAESDLLALPRQEVGNWDIKEFENKIWTFLNG